MSALVSLTLYDNNDEVIKTYQKSVIKWGLMKKAIRLGKGMSDEDFGEADFDKISEFVCELFDNQFTLQELENGADVAEVFTAFKAVINKAQSMNISPN
jgi:hypothetical protein